MKPEMITTGMSNANILHPAATSFSPMTVKGAAMAAMAAMYHSVRITHFHQFMGIPLSLNQALAPKTINTVTAPNAIQ